MNWKEVPHLFANGKFWVKTKAALGMDVSIRFGIDKLGCFQPERFYTGKSIDDCTLIARKIEDMTDEELYNYPDFKEANKNFIDKNGIDIIHTNVKKDHFTRGEFLYLLSIGVYPFDQSHFDTGEVINQNDL